MDIVMSGANSAAGESGNLWMSAPTWGERMFLVVRRSGNLPFLLNRLAPIIETSPGYQSATSYTELYRLDEAPEPYSSAYVRAWLLALAAEIDLDEIGLPDSGLPPIIGEAKVRQILNLPDAATDP